jgi:stage II sporulation protein D
VRGPSTGAGAVFFRSVFRGGRGASVVAGIAVTTALAASCRSALPRVARTALPEAPSVEFLVPAPMLRVGVLTDVRRASLSADSGVLVYDFAPNRAWTGRKSAVQRATFLGLPGETTARRFRVQVASLADASAAQEVARRAREVAKVEPSVRFNPETRTYQIRVGEFPSRSEAGSLADSLAGAGLGGPWVVEEPPSALSPRLKLLETGEELSSATIVPSRPTEELTVDNAPYRGLLELRAQDDGTLTVINVVNLEDYVKGVVPNELSPLVFPQLEAQKAQAVAARTYALHKKGQFASKGYDLCATANCQVYRGRSSEDPLSSRAVDETRGVVAFFNGAPINALYTSTCGGHTEDGSNVFEGESAPYLRGVSCAPEHSAWATIQTTASPRDLGDEDGLNRDAALLLSLGVLEPKQYSRTALRGAASAAELRAWMSRLVLSLHRKSCESPLESSINRRATFLRALVGSLCWDERAERLLSASDSDYLLRVEDRQDLTDEAERRATALLVSEGVLSPFPDNTLRVNAPVGRAEAVGILARVAAKAGTSSLVMAEFRGDEGGELKVKREDGEESIAISGAVRLFRNVEGARAAASELSIPVGEKLLFVAQEGEVTFLEAQESRLGPAADHSSRYYRWEVSLTPSAVETSMARYGSVGHVKDIAPRRLGLSGRVLELAVLGTRGELLLKGPSVRAALGLRESLFVVDRERGESGAVERFVFTGKGWGHGVGLCQVGSFGMALSGSNYSDILRHYYTGITLAKAY